jgi:DNA-binding MarR family transcriptional regulator/GNAT superfamily N-acetyltransferase
MKKEAALLRDFGRKFTRQLGLLDKSPYDPSLTLLESRVVYELAQGKSLRAKELETILGIDKGYLSRALASLGKRKLLLAETNPEDKREKWLRLSKKGKDLFQKINRVSQERSEALLSSLGRLRSHYFARSLSSAQLALNAREWIQPEEIRLRELAPGDLGWVIQRHGEIYAEEFGWNGEFEELVAEIALSFARKSGKRERAWIAEARGVRLGCIFLVKESDRLAKLRILLVEPSARGLGLGRRLVRECVEFARAAGYRKITLWTNSVLVSARRIYEAEGFRLEEEEKHFSFGHHLTGQYWAKTIAK